MGLIKFSQISVVIGSLMILRTLYKFIKGNEFGMFKFGFLNSNYSGIGIFFVLLGIYCLLLKEQSDGNK